MSKHTTAETLGDVVTEWTTNMLAAGCTTATIRTRTQALKIFANYARTDPRDATREQLAEWLASPHLKAWSRLTYFRSFRAWSDFLVATGRRDGDLLAGLRPPRTPRGAPRPLAQDAVRHLLSTHQGRVHTWLLLGAYQGLRVHEIAKIRGEDVTEDSLRVVGKGGLEAVLPTHPLVWAEAQQYPRRGYWFPSLTDHRRHIQARSVSTLLGRAIKAAGVQGTAHQLRHLYGTQVLRAAGGNLRVAQELLRHASVQTTALYTLVEDEQRRSAVLALPDYTAP